jgi:hypothetical protein
VATGADQPYFGRRVAELGAGPPPLRRRDLTVDRLATLMTALTGPDRSFRSYAGEIAAERGAAIAADHIVAEDLGWWDRNSPTEPPERGLEGDRA